MSLTVSYVSRFEDVLEPARAFLCREFDTHGFDLFARPRIVVPTAGAKAWLWNELAKRLGASTLRPDGHDGDGIVANVEIAYPGAIFSLLQPMRSRAADPWSFDRLTFTVLDLIMGPDAAALGIPFDVSREPLLAARRIAALFDAYHVRRPAMIARWEAGQAVLSPVATSSRSVDDEWAADMLAPSDAWQFRTWHAARRQIGIPSPPTRTSLDTSAACEPLLVAGLQSLSLQQITVLRTLAEACDVHVWLVHPSPPLRAKWAQTPPVVSMEVPPPRPVAELPEDLDPLVATWLHGARETQMLLASQGIYPEHASPTTPAADGATGAPASLLSRVQQSITTAVNPSRQPHDLATDASITIHRCHTLSRQAEVLHDALLHAFHDAPGLQPHEVVIVSPCLTRLAPHLEAVFNRQITGSTNDPLKLPLVIADRGLHEVSEAAQLLIEVMQLVGSRCSVEQFRTVATHPLVQRHFHIDDDTIRCWDRLIERASIHWAFDAAHRALEDFPAAAREPHTWRAGLERMLLGAVLPSAVATAPADGQVRAEGVSTLPLDDVALGSLPAIETLARIFEVVRTLDETCRGATAARPTSHWCTAIEIALAGLCGPEAGELAEPLRALRRLRETASSTPVPFHDVRTLLEESLTSVVGRQPLRTGAITATSMVPLRDVPFRVICIAGYDDGAINATESQGDDLVARQSLAGDGDPRIDSRRALLDCVLAARDRVVVTCNGIDIRNNKSLPLVTPLAELVDFAVRHGVRPPDGDDPSGIEIPHPRHAVSRRNFVPDKVQPGLTWSHDAAALAASRALGGDEPRRVTSARSRPEMPIVELASLEDMVRDPLKLYLKKTLGIDLWRDDEEFPAATFPLALSDWDIEDLARELLDLLVNREGDEAQRIQGWVAGVRATGRVPFGEFGREVLEHVRQLAIGIKTEAAAAKPPIPLHGFETLPVHIQLPNRLLTGTLPNFHAGSNQFVTVRVSEGERTSWGMPLHMAALHLLIAHADAHADRPPPQQALVVARHGDWTVNGDHKTMMARKVTLADPLRHRDAAIARLAEICDLLPLALAAPCGRFRNAAAATVRNRDTGRGAFQTCVGGPRFRLTREAVVYGPTPRFDDVFAPESPELAFHEAFERLFTLSRTYVLS